MITVKGIDPQMIANNVEPLEPTHPGELLKEEKAKKASVGLRRLKIRAVYLRQDI